MSAPPVLDRPLCRHCQVAVCCRPRGLCWACFGRTEIRNSHPVAVNKFTRRGTGLGRTHVAPRFPTTAVPGSPEKIAVLAERALAGELLFHRQDARGAGGGAE